MLRNILYLRAQCSKIKSRPFQINPKLIEIFTDDKKKKSGLQAIWGESIFYEIASLNNRKLQVTLLEHLNKYSLQRHISECLEAAKVTTEEISNSKNIVMQAFDLYQGVLLNEFVVASQKRISHAVNKSNGFMTFYPSSVVAPTVFEAIKEQFTFQNRKQMILGRPGISKTMSFVLAQHLLNLSTTFRFQNYEDAKLFVEHKLLQKKIAKISYFSFQQIENATLRRLILMFVNQFTELPQRLKNIPENIDASGLRSLFGGIRDFYQSKDIRCFAIIDQINTLASLFKRLNDFQRSGKEENSKTKKLKQDVDTLGMIYRSLLSLPFVLNSSKNIEQYLLGQSFDKDGERHTLNINYHSRHQTVRCDTVNQIGDIRTVETYRIIWFELVRQLGIRNGANVPKKVQEEAIKTCDYWANSQKSYFVTSLTIRQAVNRIILQKLADAAQNATQNTRSLEIIQDQTGLKVKKFINDVVQDIKSYCIKQEQQRSKKFLMDGNAANRMTKINIILACFSYLQLHPDATEVPYKSQKMKQISQLNIDLLHDKLIFQIIKRKNKNSQNEKFLRLNVSRSEFDQLFNSLFFSLISDQSNLDIIRTFMNKSKLFLAITTELTINSLLEKYKKSFFSISFPQYFPQNQIKYSVSVFPTTLISKFIHFKTTSYSLQKNFKQIFEKVRQQKLTLNNYCFAFPINKNFNTSQNSPSFDSVAVNINETGQFEITSFDYTISSSTGDINKKLLKAFSLIRKIFVLTQFQIKTPNLKLQSPLRKLFSILEMPQESDSKWTDVIQQLKGAAEKNSEDLKAIRALQAILQNRKKISTVELIGNVKNFLKSSALGHMKESPNQKSTKCNVAKWTHVVACRQTLIDNILPEKLKLLEAKYFGTKVSFKLANLSSVTFSAVDQSQMNPQQKLLINSLQKSLEEVKLRVT